MRVCDPGITHEQNCPTVARLLNRAKHQNFSMENERLHEISERIGLKHNLINQDIF
jgi:hypothetical protein